jgi:GT2 family glycosyltransferase
VADGNRLLIISPVRNEADNLELVARALARQTRPPDRWIVVDDCSDDRTPEVIAELSEWIPFMRALSTAPGRSPEGVDRHARGASPRAFNRALREFDWRGFTHVGKLDGDIELPTRYFELLLDRFDDDPALGVAGGTLVEPGRNGWRRVGVPTYHVRGALKLYSRECFEAIGGVEERLGWDTIDETYARMLGFRTRSFEDLVARHHRPVASADGLLRGRARHGQAAYVLRYGAPWVLLRSLKVAGSRPLGLSGAAFVYGYLRAVARSEPKVEDEEFRRFVRRELRGRIAKAPLRLGKFVRV